MRKAAKVLAVASLASLAGAVVPVAVAQPPIRIGASLSQTGPYAALGQNILGGYQLCVKHTNDKGGVLGRRFELVVHDDRSDPLIAVRLYEELITQDKVDLVLGPITLRIFPKTQAQGTVELAKRRGLQVVLAETYPKGTTDFGGILGRVKTANPDVLAAAAYDSVVITRVLKELDINPRMFGATIDVAFPKFSATLGRAAEFVYGASQWEPELVTLRAGGLIPIARQYPGAREFVEAHRKEFPGADLSYQTAGSYGGCQILVEAIKRAGSLEGEKIRDAILKMDFNTVYGGFKVDPDGFQIAHKMVIFQWQDGKKVIVWPEELAPGKPRFPTPPWSERR